VPTLSALEGSAGGEELPPALPIWHKCASRYRDLHCVLFFLCFFSPHKLTLPLKKRKITATDDNNNNI
jgi:hypothetical protein